MMTAACLKLRNCLLQSMLRNQRCSSVIRRSTSWCSRSCRSCRSRSFTKTWPNPPKETQAWELPRPQQRGFKPPGVWCPGYPEESSAAGFSQATSNRLLQFHLHLGTVQGLNDRASAFPSGETNWQLLYWAVSAHRHRFLKATSLQPDLELG